MTKKKIFIISWIMTVIIIAFFIFQAIKPSGDNKFTISIKSLVDKSGEECIVELEKSGVKLPIAFEDPEQQAEAVKMIVYGISEGRFIDGAIPYSNEKLAELTKAIADIALKYDPRYHSIKK